MPRRNVSREGRFAATAAGAGTRTAFDSIAASLYTQGSWAPSLAATATASTSADTFRAPSRRFASPASASLSYRNFPELIFRSAGKDFWLTWFGLVPYAVIHGIRLWQPFTYLFLHAGILHILLNLLYLAMFGADLEHTWGARKFYTYFFLCGVGAGVINVAVKMLSDPHGLGSALISDNRRVRSNLRNSVGECGGAARTAACGCFLCR